MPPAAVTAVHTCVPSTKSFTVLPASAVPEKVGVAVVNPLCAGTEITGTAGAIESTLKARAVDAADTLPAASVAVAVAECAPWPIAEDTQLHEPSPAAVAVHTCAPSTETFTVLPASAVPESVGVVVVSAAFCAGATIAGAAGAIESMLKALAAVATEALPAASVAVAVAECAP